MQKYDTIANNSKLFPAIKRNKKSIVKTFIVIHDFLRDSYFCSFFSTQHKTWVQLWVLNKSLFNIAFKSFSKILNIIVFQQTIWGLSNHFIEISWIENHWIALYHKYKHFKIYFEILFINTREEKCHFLLFNKKIFWK